MHEKRVLFQVYCDGIVVAVATVTTAAAIVKSNKCHRLQLFNNFYAFITVVFSCSWCCRTFELYQCIFCKHLICSKILFDFLQLHRCPPFLSVDLSAMAFLYIREYYNLACLQSAKHPVFWWNPFKRDKLQHPNRIYVWNIVQNRSEILCLKWYFHWHWLTASFILSSIFVPHPHSHNYTKILDTDFLVVFFFLLLLHRYRATTCTYWILYTVLNAATTADLSKKLLFTVAS